MSAVPPVFLQDVEYRIAGNAVLSGVSIASDAKRIGVIGRNGSGKSTLSRIMTGLLAPSNGQVKIYGVDVFKNRRDAIRTVGILFQNPEHQIIFPTVSEEIAFGLGQLGYSKTEAASETNAILTQFNKEHWKDAPIQALSQGQKHLVCMMSVLAMRPKLLVLDEPFAGLDIPTRMQLTRQLEVIDTQLLHISHDIRDLEAYDEIFWLEAGKIRTSGAPDRVLPEFAEEMIRLGGGNDLAHLTL